jgi:pimeloyl-ACP methyl ester carboxylesterase
VVRNLSRSWRILLCWLAAFVVVALPVDAIARGGKASSPAPADTWKWRVDTPERALQGASGIRESVWSLHRPPYGPYDRIGLHRYRGNGKAFATVLYLPGTNMNGAAALRDQAHNLWLYLAARGVDVFALDYRTHAIPSATPATALGALREWDTAAFLGDVEAAAAWTRKQESRNALFVAGFSRGGSLAYAHALAHPGDTSGLVILDGPFKSQKPTGRYDTKAQVKKLQDSAAWASDVGGARGWDAREQLMEAVIRDPASKSPSPGYATVGDLLSHVLQSAWGPGGLANPEGGISKPRVLATLLYGYDRYYPAIQEIEAKSIADHADDPDTHLDDGWGQLRLPIIVFASTGMGANWTRDVLYSANRSGSHDVEAHVLDRYGHLDVVVGENARIRVYRPILAWLHAHGGSRSARTAD